MVWSDHADLNAHYAYRNLEYFIEDMKMRRSQIQSSMSDEVTEKLYPVENRWKKFRRIKRTTLRNRKVFFQKKIFSQRITSSLIYLSRESYHQSSP